MTRLLSYRLWPFLGIGLLPLRSLPLGWGHDGPYSPALVRATVRNFRVEQVSADKGYSAIRNLRTAENIGAALYFPFKSNTSDNGRVCAIWREMWLHYQLRRDDFLSHYHKRSNVESAFSMIQVKFGGHLRSKGDTAQVKNSCSRFCVTIFAS